MKIKLTRDDARLIQVQFFPYLELLIETKIRDSRADIDLQLNCKVIRCNFLEVVKIFTRKLAGDITCYKLLIALPLKTEAVYLLQLRQRILNELHLQMM